MSSLPTAPVGKKIPKNQRSKRALLERAPKLIENVKSSMVLQGQRSSQLIKYVLKDMHSLKSPDSKVLTKKNLTRPFEDPSSIEFLAEKNDQPLFAFGSHSKKRSHNLILGRLFDNHILDMFEFGVDETTFKRMHDFGGEREAVVRIGSKPMILFQGDAWDTDVDLIVMKNFWLDYFRGSVLPKINLAALDRVIAISVIGKKIFFRHYGVVMKKAGAKTPRVVLDEVGPRMDLTFRRRQSASDELQKQSLKQPRAGTIKQAKNIETGPMGDKMGRIHMKRQDLDKMALARMKGLKRTRADSAAADSTPSTDSPSPATSTSESSAPARKKQAVAK